MIAPLQAQGRIARPSFDADVWYETLGRVSSPNAGEIAQRIYADDLDRIQALEGKLGRHRTWVSLVVPLSVATVTLGAARGDVWVTSLGVLAVFHMITAAFAVFKADEATERYVVVPADVKVASDRVRDLGPWIASVQLACVLANQARGITLNNWIHVAQVSLVWAAALLGLAILLAAA